MDVLAQTGPIKEQPLKPDNSPAAVEHKRLLERELDRYLHLLTQHSDPEQVIVFGSLASGDIQPWSDIDLAIVEQTELPFWQRLRRFRKLLKPRVGTDLLVYTPEEFERLRYERAFFRDEILPKRVVVYERAARRDGSKRGSGLGKSLA